ncbi:MAG: bifunctional phosphoribosylaminoimidazolecarboxamide formyltransferase/IMP cyclohydrolase, partial [Gemmatimonadetes bacterium]|nr:bifunctional phosphoribosylaminoimidazolecarboxamide formyltransferase/IMP cyclohydrolase [Gemmatimonadota bacterium]
MNDTPRRALLSVSDKRGIELLAAALHERGWEILSTGGTAKAIEAAGVPVLSVSAVTGHPEMLDGRVKTLHPAVHAGLLARRDRPDDMAALDTHGYRPIDLVAVNLYPFRETIAQGDVGVPAAMEKVDIGGPTMIRAAAKSHADVWVIVDPSDYAVVLSALDEGGEHPDLRRRLAAKVFAHTSAYDAAIAGFLADGNAEDADTLHMQGHRALRYGENPDQPAAFYARAGGGGLAAIEQLHGKELSYNNYLDLDGALLALAPFALSEAPTVVIVKHTTPCGIAQDTSLSGAYGRALRTDPVSAFGSVIAVNRVVDAEAATAISGLFVECLIAPDFDPGALEILTRKKNVRLIRMPETADVSLELPAGLAALPGGARAARFLLGPGLGAAADQYRTVYGGVLRQRSPLPPWPEGNGGEWRVVSERAPTAAEERDLRFAWAAVYAVKSNAIVFAR